MAVAAASGSDELRSVGEREPEEGMERRRVRERGREARVILRATGRQA